MAVRENQNINMTCRADGFPTPKIIWRREDGQSITVERKKKVMVYDGEVLHLTKLSRNEVSVKLPNEAEAEDSDLHNPLRELISH